MCEPDPVFTRARSSFPSSTCHRRRRLRRQPLRPRHFRHRWSKWVVEWTPAEEQPSMRVLTVLPSPRTRQHRPRRPYVHRARLRRRGTNSVMVFAVPYARRTRIELVDLGRLKISMHANMLARARHGRLDGTLLLLTWLEVRAYPAPHTVRHRHPPLQLKLWHELNCF